jgi:hypothetical protein
MVAHAFAHALRVRKHNLDQAIARFHALDLWRRRRWQVGQLQRGAFKLAKALFIVSPDLVAVRPKRTERFV